MVIVIMLSDFNTSYVAVQPQVYEWSKDSRKFQYILCCGSTLRMVGMIDRLFHFNTSYVAVQRWYGGGLL